MTTTVQKSALVRYTPAEMFALVADIESYPRFLPWCSGARIKTQHDDDVEATIDISKAGVEKSFTTHNRHQVHKMIEMKLVDGPFRRLEGYWRFDPLGDAACKISLDLEFEYSSRMLQLVVGPIFSQIANTLVDAFHQRAREIYGKR